jgi:2-dehydro-3-deoxygalactonokinase
VSHPSRLWKLREMQEFFINCDWGTSHFRLRAIRIRDTGILAEFRSDDGVALLAASHDDPARSAIFQRVLSEGLGRLGAAVGQSLAAATVVISGMASSSIGWHELPYAPVPFCLDGANLIWRELGTGEGLDGFPVVLVSGARTDSDVMRGEETQALGVFRLPVAMPLADRSILVLPGTHSKHLQVAAGQIVGFQTTMTGELFDVLSKQSVLKHSVDADESSSAGLEGDFATAFQAGIAQSRELGLSAALFRVRTRQVLQGHPSATNRAFLSGVLIGAELAYLSKTPWRDQPILLAAGSALEPAYWLAFEAMGLGQRLTSIAAPDVERLSALGQLALLPHLGLSGLPG